MLDGAANVFADVPGSFRLSQPFGRYFAGMPWTEGEGEGVVRALKELKDASVQSLEAQVAKLRVLKSEAEVRAMRIAGRVAGRAHSRVMARRNWVTERDIALELKIEMLRNNCDDEAYVPVVAGGENSLSIHYVQNNAVLRYDFFSKQRSAYTNTDIKFGRYGTCGCRSSEWTFKDIRTILTIQSNTAVTFQISQGHFQILENLQPLREIFIKLFLTFKDPASHYAEKTPVCRWISYTR
jgi:peptidase M24-like protein